MDSLRPPKGLSFGTSNLADAFRRFKQNFEIFMQATGHDAKDSATKTAILLNIIGEEGVEIFNTFDLKADDRKNYDVVLNAFEEYALPHKNIVVERYKFNSRKQAEGELFDNFVTDLKKLVKSCEFQDQTESVIRDRIVLGIRDKMLQESLLRVKDLTMQKAIDLCKASELSKEQAQTLQDHKEFSLHAISSKPKSYKDTTAATNFYGSNNKGYKQKLTYSHFQNNVQDKYHCKKCNTKHTRANCPAFGKNCKLCGKLNHFASGCKFKKVRELTKTEVCTNNNKSNQIIPKADFVVDNLKFTVNMLNKPLKVVEWKKIVKVENKNIEFKLDTGAQVNVIPLNIFKSLNSKSEIRNPSLVLEAYGGSKINTYGVVTLCCTLNNSDKYLEFAVVNNDKKPLLGLEGCIALKLIERIDINSVNSSSAKAEFIEQNADVFKGIGNFGFKCHINISPDVLPVVKPPRRVPIAVRDKLKCKLDQLEGQGIITKVDNPQTWVSNLVIIEKPDGSLRLCLDPVELNKVIKRQYCLIPTVEEISAKLCNKSVFTVLDLRDGFYQIELDTKSSEYCTFSSPFGCYKFNRLPFGLSCAPELFQKINERNFGDIPGVIVYFDDILIAADSERQHDDILNEVMKRAKQFNVKFNSSKIQYRVNEVKYLGHVFSKEGIKPDPERVKAILALENPKNKTELQRVLGMMNYVRKFVPNMSTLTAPLRELLKKNMEWQWLPSHTQALDRLKQLISSAPVLGTFNSKKKIQLQCDSSKDGIGCCLMCEGQPVAFASRSLTETEQGYAQIEKELLSIVTGASKFHHYIYGREVEVQTDHKPLVSIMAKNMASVSSPRLQRMKLKLLKYNLAVKFLPGKLMYIADLLSRSFIKDPVEDDKEMIEVIHALSKNVQLSKRRLEEFQEKTKADPVLSQVIEYQKTGWPVSKTSVPDSIKFYFKLQDQICVENDLVFLNDKIVVPATLRKQMLDILHESHFGIQKTKARARQVLYWPGINKDIEDLIGKCTTCEKFRPSNCKEPLLNHELPELPFEKLAADICEYGGSNYLVVGCYLTKWLEIVPIQGKTAEEVISKLKVIFSTHGIPKIFMSDNMPFASYKFKQFSASWGFDLVTSSPHYPRSNGFAEKMVGIAKSILRKSLINNTDFYLALMEYRNTPIVELDVSPAQMLMSRQLRSKLPVVKSMLKPVVQTEYKKKLKRKQELQSYYYNRSAKYRPDFKKHDSVLLRKHNLWEPAKVISKHNCPRSYIVQDQEGKEYRRNKFHLRRRNNPVTNREYCNFDSENEINDDHSDDNGIIGQEAPLVNNQQSQSPKQTRCGRIVKAPAKYKDYVVN